MSRYFGTQPLYGTFEKQIIIGTGVDLDFPLNYAPGSAFSILVVSGGNFLEGEVDYTIGNNGVSIVFPIAPILNQRISLIYLGREIATLREPVENEFPTGAYDGVNTTFTTVYKFVEGSLQVYYNGIRLAPGGVYDYTVTGLMQFDMNIPPDSGDLILVDYRKMS